MLGDTAASLAEGRDVLVIGLLSSKEELGLVGSSLSVRPLQPDRGVPSVVATALAELNRARRAASIAELPPLVAVACDETEPDATEYLLDSLRVQLIIGPVSSARVEPALQRLGERAFLIPPFADAPDLEPTATDASGFLLSCRPNRSNALPYFLDAVAEVRRLLAASRGVPEAALQPALVASTDVATASFADALSDQSLAAAGIRRVRYGDLTGRSLTAVLMSMAPPVDWVIAASSEDNWSVQMNEYDTAYFAEFGLYPDYLLGDKRALLALGVPAENTEARAGSRFVGLDYERGASSQLAREAFATAYAAELGVAPEPALEYAYDCTYLSVYAAVAAGLRLRRPMLGLRPEAIATGFWALEGGPPLSVGERDVAEIVARLVASNGSDGTLDLAGASGELDLESAGTEGGNAILPARRYFNVAAPNGELYCWDEATRESCDMGVVFANTGGPPSRSGKVCPCFGQP